MNTSLVFHRKSLLLRAVAGSVSFAIILLILPISGCGKSGDSETATLATVQMASVSKRIEVIETQLQNLRKQTDVLQQDFASIESTRKSLESELGKLKTELSVTTSPGGTEKVVVTETVESHRSGWSRFLSFMWTLLLIVFILLAMFVILKLFLGRWYDTEEEATSEMNEHGTIRVSPEVERAMRAEQEKQVREEHVEFKDPNASPEPPPTPPAP